MKTRIVDNGLAQENIQRDMIRALAGTWGQTEIDARQTRLDMGRCALTVAQGGENLTNGGAYDALALVLYTDGTYAIEKVAKGSETTKNKAISLAVMIARN